MDECGSGGLNTHLAGRTLAASAVVRCGGGAEGNVCRDSRGGAAGSQRDSLSGSFAADRGREMGRGGQTDESALPRRAIAGAGAHLSLPQFPHL